MAAGWPLPAEVDNADEASGLFKIALTSCDTCRRISGTDRPQIEHGIGKAGLDNGAPGMPQTSTRSLVLGKSM